jgi:ribonuclease G
LTEEILINVTPQETRVAVIEQGVVRKHIERARRAGCRHICMGRVIWAL